MCVIKLSLVCYLVNGGAILGARSFLSLNMRHHVLATDERLEAAHGHHLSQQAIKLGFFVLLVT